MTVYFRSHKYDPKQKRVVEEPIRKRPKIINLQGEQVLPLEIKTEPKKEKPKIILTGE